ncbi:hypothetical protein BH11PSE10_BH11PSE10_08850 [soil metagenome]
MKYRLALDLGSTSLGWAVVLLKKVPDDVRPVPCAIVRSGVRIFSDGREPAAKGQVGASLAVTRRAARAMRRRRDRLLKRKARMHKLLVDQRFFPADIAERKALELLNPYELRAKGLDAALTPAEFARALFHINQRRGFFNNRKTDKGSKDSSALLHAISELDKQMDPMGADGKPRTVGELLHRRFTDESKPPHERTVRARPNGMAGAKLAYDLYIDRRMIAAEFDALWAKQSELQPATFNEQARASLRDCLLFQRALRPVKPGRCTLIPYLHRAALALPSQQRFRMYQEVNNLKVQRIGLPDEALSPTQRNQIIAMLERPAKEMKKAHELSFDAIRSALQLGGGVRFNLEDVKRDSLKGNSTTASLSKRDHFGPTWHEWSERQQDAIVHQLVNQQRRDVLIRRLQRYCLVDEARAARIADAGLPDGYGSLSRKALSQVLLHLRADVRSYADAARLAGYHHSDLSHNSEVPGRTHPVQHVVQETGEIKTLHAFNRLPYYGEFLQRHVGFADPDAKLDPSADPDKLPTHLLERFHGRIANPTVHVGLNQVRVVVNALIQSYGHPSEVVIEVASELKRRPDHRSAEYRKGAITEANFRPYCSCAGCVNVRQKLDGDLNRVLRQEAAEMLDCAPERVSRDDVTKLRLYKEMERRDGFVACPYSGKPISRSMALSPEVEVDHILPRSRTLDDGRANKTLCIKRANRIKGEWTPYEAKDLFAREGWLYEDIERRVEKWGRIKAFRFGKDAMKEWLRDHKDFLARALNDTRYLCRIAQEYLSLVCPADTRVIPGQMTAELRHRFGLNNILGVTGEKNRDDHRHHAVDACVIAVTDRGLLKRFADASAEAHLKGLDKLNIPDPWPSYREHVRRAVHAIRVSRKPDHGHEGGMMEATAYGIGQDGSIKQKKKADGSAGREVKNLIRISEPRQPERHGLDTDGRPLAYVGYLGGSNYCIEIVRNEKGTWEGEVVTTFAAYQRVAEEERRLRNSDSQNGRIHDVATAVLRNSERSIKTNRSLVMRLMIGDSVLIEDDDEKRLLRVVKIDPSTNVVLAEINEAGELKKRHDDASDVFRYTNLRGGSFQKAKARRITISPIGELRDPGFKA